MNKYTIYTDGSCLGNPGPGGWGALIIDSDQGYYLSGSHPDTTNNRMELTAVIEALRSLENSGSLVELHTDSKYVCDAVLKDWIGGWQRKGWKNAAKKPVANKELWLQLIDLIETHEVNFHWVKAHNGHPENEFVDDLAQNAAREQSAAVRQLLQAGMI